MIFFDNPPAIYSPAPRELLGISGKPLRQELKQGLVFPSMIFPTGLVFNYITTVGSNADTSTYTFSNVPIGPAVPGRVILVGGAGSGGTINTTNGIEIGGSNATVHVRSIIINGNFKPNCAIGSRLLETGTTTTIILRFSQNISNAVIFVATINNYQSSTPIDVDVDEDDTGTTVSYSSILDVQRNGIAFCVLGKRNDSETVNWSSATQNNQHTRESYTYAAASYRPSVTENAREEIASWSTGAKGAMCGVSFR